MNIREDRRPTLEELEAAHASDDARRLESIDAHAAHAPRVEELRAIKIAAEEKASAATTALGAADAAFASADPDDAKGWRGAREARDLAQARQRRDRDAREGAVKAYAAAESERERMRADVLRWTDLARASKSRIADWKWSNGGRQAHEAGVLAAHEAENPRNPHVREFLEEPDELAAAHPGRSF